MKAVYVFTKCHGALHEDCALTLYKNTLILGVLFTHQPISFFRALSSSVSDTYFLQDYPIFKINDIISKIYIVHRGEVSILGPDDSIFEILEVGS